MPEEDAGPPPKRTRIYRPMTPQAGQQSHSQLTRAELAEALSRNKAWRKAGAVHDTFCFACRQPDVLSGCVTCRRSYHEACKPPGSAWASPRGERHWYCEVCVVRNWHVDPPPLTPPPSPGLGGHESGDHRGPEPPTIPTPGVPQLLHSFGERITVSASVSANNDLPSAGAVRPSASSKPPTIRSRKSRYTTLSKEVDSALRLLYSELETAAETRDKVANLEEQVAMLRRELGLKQQELELTRKSVEVARASQAEVTRLRLEAEAGRTSLLEITSLREEKEKLQKELETSRARLDELTETLQGWKQKLSGLVGD